MTLLTRFYQKLLKAFHIVRGTYPSTSTFEEKIKQLSTYDLSEIVENFDAEHAAIVIEQIYEKAAREKKPIRHVTGCFDPIVYEKYPSILNAFKACVERGVPISIIVTEPEKFKSNDITFTTYVKGLDGGGLVSIEKTDENLTHVLVVGDSGSIFRFETNADTHNGKVSFNAKNIGKHFVQSFDSKFHSLKAAA